MKNRSKADSRYISRCCKEYDETLSGSVRCTAVEMDRHLFSSPIITKFRERHNVPSDSNSNKPRGHGKRRKCPDVFFLDEDDSELLYDSAYNKRRQLNKGKVRFSSVAPDAQAYEEAQDDEEVATDRDEDQAEEGSGEEGGLEEEG